MTAGELFDLLRKTPCGRDVRVQDNDGDQWEIDCLIDSDAGGFLLGIGSMIEAADDDGDEE